MSTKVHKVLKKCLFFFSGCKLQLLQALKPTITKDILLKMSLESWITMNDF